MKYLPIHPLLIVMLGTMTVLRGAAAGVDQKEESAFLLKTTLLVEAGSGGVNGVRTCIAQLKARGISVNAARESSGGTALMNAAKSKYGTQIMPQLLEAGAAINAVDDAGISAVLRALEWRQSDNISLLRKAGANTKAETQQAQAIICKAEALAKRDKNDRLYSQNDEDAWIEFTKEIDKKETAAVALTPAKTVSKSSKPTSD